MVTQNQREKLLSATRALVSLMQECGVMNLEYLCGGKTQPRILMASLTPASPAPSYLRLSAPGCCEKSTLPVATPVPPTSPDSSGTCSKPLSYFDYKTMLPE